MIVEFRIATIDEAGVAVIGHAGIEFAGKHHEADAFLPRNLGDGDSWWRLRVSSRSMKKVISPGAMPELGFEDAAGPQRRSHHVFRHADALAFEIRRTGNLGILTHEDAGVVEAPRCEYRNADKALITPSLIIISSDIDISETSNSAKLSCRQNISAGPRTVLGEIDAVNFDAPVDNRPAARIAGDGETKL